MYYIIPFTFFGGIFVILSWPSLKMVGSASEESLLLIAPDLKHDCLKCREHILWFGKTSSLVNPQWLSQICRFFGCTGNLTQNNSQLIRLACFCPPKLG